MISTPNNPSYALDEKPVTLHADIRPPIPAAPGRTAKRDNEYKRCGTANVFCAVEPKAGRHFTLPTPNRSAAEFAQALETVVPVPVEAPVVETLPPVRRRRPVLLVTAGLLIASFVRLTTIDKGFDVERVLAVDVSLPAAKYPNPEPRAAFFQRVLDQARALPGVKAASLSSYLPLQGESWIDVVKTENDARPEAQLPTTNIRFVSPGYFQTLHIALRAGRDFEPGDRTRMVAVISAALARKLWPGLDPIGRKLNDYGRVQEVVGVAADVRSTSLDKDPVNMLYIPYWQGPRFSSSILVRTGMDPAGIASALRAAIWIVDSEVPVPEERTLDQVMSASVARRRFQMLLVLLFAAAALALAAFGTYGVVSYAVTRRRAELGIRMALGAQRGDVLRMVLRQGMTPAVAGLCAGTVAALGIGQYVATLLFQVSPRDPMAFGISTATLLAVSAAACLIPARRATRVNPIDALRFD